MDEKSVLLVGKPAVEAAFDSGRRRIDRLFVSDTLPVRRAAPFLERAADAGVPVQSLSPLELSRKTEGRNHGGMAAEAGPRRLSPFEEMVDRLASAASPPLAFALENFHDAHNLGYALRCLEALGVDAVLLTPRDWGAGDATISHSSSGAYDRMMIAPLIDPRGQIRRLEALGMVSLLATAGADRSIYDYDLRAAVLVAVGGEFRGLSPELRKACRHSGHLPMSDSIPSFPAGHAAAILAAEANRQRRKNI